MSAVGHSLLLPPRVQACEPHHILKAEQLVGAMASGYATDGSQLVGGQQRRQLRQRLDSGAARDVRVVSVAVQ